MQSLSIDCVRNAPKSLSIDRECKAGARNDSHCSRLQGSFTAKLACDTGI